MSKRQHKTSSKSSSSSASSSSPTVEDIPGGETVFTGETKVRATAERFPGALAMEVISNMKSALLTASGEELEDRSVRPIAVLYYRSILSKKSQGAQAREMLTLCAALDSLLRGKPAPVADILAQRLKARNNRPPKGDALVHFPTHGSGPVGCGRTGSSQRTRYSPSRGLQGVQVEMESAEHKRSERRSERKDKGLQGRERLLEKGRQGQASAGRVRTRSDD